jgi:hypothetical protein
LPGYDSQPLQKNTGFHQGAGGALGAAHHFLAVALDDEGDLHRPRFVRTLLARVDNLDERLDPRHQLLVRHRVAEDLLRIDPEVGVSALLVLKPL